MAKTIWITWEKQIRNKSMSTCLDIPLYEILISGSRLKRYVLCIKRTFQILLKEKPNIVITQNPSLILVVFITLLKKILRYQFIIDAHYFGVIAPKRNKIIQMILNICNRLAMLVIVTNDNHARYILLIGGRPFICQDPLPNLDQYITMNSISEEKKIFFICSFDIDEPYHEAFEAARQLNEEGFKFYVSGNYKKYLINQEDYPYIKLLGYIPDDEFYFHLFTSSLVLDLTTNQDCLVCGAYESISAEKPLVTSNTVALKSYFSKGVIFTDHSSNNIASAIRKAYQERDILITDIKEWKKNNIEEHNKRIMKLSEIISI